MDRVPYSRPRHQAPALPRIAALYCRMSSKTQADDDRHKTSLKTQLAALQRNQARVRVRYGPADDLIARCATRITVLD